MKVYICVNNITIFYHFITLAFLSLIKVLQASPSHALSSPDLLSTCHSSPDLITSVLERYRLAVAEAELRAAAVASQKPSQLQRLNGTTQSGGHWQTIKGCGNYMLPSPPPINVKSQVYIVLMVEFYVMPLDGYEI